MFQDNNVGQGFHLQPHGGFMQDGNQGPNNMGMNNNGGGGGGGYGQGGQRRQYGGSDQPKKPKVFAPVTLKMVQQSSPRPDDLCEFDGDTINDIIIVGRLLKRIEDPMRTTFEINDNTCTFHVIFYHKGEHQVPTALKSFVYEQFTYAKIYGNIRVFKEEKAIVGMNIKRIEKFDEVTNHFLSVFISYCIRKKGILKPRELAMDSTNNHGPVNQTGGNEAMNIDSGHNMQQQQHQYQGNNQGGGGNGYQGGYNNNRGNFYSNNNYRNNNNYQNRNYNNNPNNHNNNQFGNGGGGGGGSNNNQNYHHNNQQSHHNQQESGNNINDNDLKDTLYKIIQQVLQNNPFAQRDELKQRMSNYCREDRFERVLNRLMQDGQVIQAHDNNTFCLV